MAEQELKACEENRDPFQMYDAGHRRGFELGAKFAWSQLMPKIDFSASALLAEAEDERIQCAKRADSAEARLSSAEAEVERLRAEVDAMGLAMLRIRRDAVTIDDAMTIIDPFDLTAAARRQQEEPMPAESVIERLKRLEAEATNGEWTVAKDAQGSLGKEWKRIEGPQYPVVHARSFDRRLNGYTETYCGVQVRAADADLIVAMRNALPALLAVAEAAHELYVLRGRISPEEYFNSSEACRARTKLDLAVVDLRDMEAGGE